VSKDSWLIACEESGVVREAFRSLGVKAVSCDLLPTAQPGIHYQGDVFDILGDDWAGVIAFPPCTHLAVSGARHFAAKRADGRQQQGIDFFLAFTTLDHVPKVAIENPVGIMSSIYRKPDQIIQPWQFGHPESKKTCLWLKGLPGLVPTDVLPLPPGGRWSNQTKDGQNRLLVDGTWIGYNDPRTPLLRSRTYQGIADAMAEQWSPQHRQEKEEGR
jgi:hypothetical protein